MNPKIRKGSLIPPDPLVTPTSRFKLNWGKIKTGRSPLKNFESNKPSFETAQHANPQILKKKGKIVMYKVSEVFDDDDFTLQNYESHLFLGVVESNLEDYCEMIYAQNKGKPVSLEILQNYAVFNEEIGKWVRCVLIDVLSGDEGSASAAVFRQLDYGGWFLIPLDCQQCPGEYVQEVPELFFQFPVQGVTASQSENPILGKRIPINILKEMKNCLILCRIQDYFPPKTGCDVPHINITILNVISPPKRVRTSLNRRNSI